MNMEGQIHPGTMEFTGVELAQANAQLAQSLWLCARDEQQEGINSAEL